MDKRAWIGQLKRQVEKQGADKASWYVFWNDPDTGRQQQQSCGPGKVGERAADKLADKRHSELVTGTYKPKDKHSWSKLREEYEKKIADRFDEPSRMAVRMALNSFERFAKPTLLRAVTTDKIDQFATNRLAGNKENPKASAATVNKELRYVRLLLNVAVEWGWLQKVPKIRFLKLAKKLPTFVPADHFTAIYKACEKAKSPNPPNISATDWWRGLLVMGYMTGWRVGQLLSLNWSDIDLESGEAITRAEVVGNKGDRDERIALHPMVIEHLRKLQGTFCERVFPWDRMRAALWAEFRRIQEAAVLPSGKPMPKAGKNGGWYGFHDLRRGFATLNASKMDLFELQGLMQHKSLTTTQLYVNMSKRYSETVERLFVPTLQVEVG